jgi:hypothetical protein
MIRFARLLALWSIGILLSNCNTKPVKEKKAAQTKLSFTAVKGIKFYEVKRRFTTGLSFNELGFQQEPTWMVQFISNDSIAAWSPQKQRMQNFFLMYDHGDVYNFAKEYFRFKKITKDSLIFQRLQLENKVILKDIRSDVNITYYSEDYIKNKLKTTVEELRKPTARDTAYVRKISDQSNRNPANIDSAFAGRQPVELTSLSKSVTVNKISTVDEINGRTQAYDYLFPLYKVVIHNAYKDFAYQFTTVVDAKGKMYLGTFYGEIPEFHEVRKKVLTGIIDVYLQNLLKIKPGSTLGMPHSSEITLQVSGKTAAK